MFVCRFKMLLFQHKLVSFIHVFDTNRRILIYHIKPRNTPFPYCYFVIDLLNRFLSSLFHSFSLACVLNCLYVLYSTVYIMYYI